MNPNKTTRTLTLLLVSLLLITTGCARTISSQQWAKGGVVLCKHCNCFMSANEPPETTCSVCDCGTSVAQCQL